MTRNRDLDIYELLGVEYGCDTVVLMTLAKSYMEDGETQSRERRAAICLAMEICSSERRRRKYDRKYLKGRCEEKIAKQLLKEQYETFTDYYGILETFPEASKEVIRKKFLRLSLRNHPDKHQEASAEMKDYYARRFREVKEAWDMLGDEKGRMLYNGIYGCRHSVNILDDGKGQRCEYSSRDQGDACSSGNTGHGERMEDSTDADGVATQSISMEGKSGNKFAITHQSSSLLFVKNFYGKNKELEEAAEVYGVVKKIRLKGHKMAHILMESPEGAKRVLGNLNGKKVGKFKITLSYFMTKAKGETRIDQV